MISESNLEEQQYLDIVRNIIEVGEARKDRTGTGIRSLFSPGQMRFSLDNNSFPLLTTKKVFIRPIFEELIWFIRGCTDSTILSQKNVKIWDGNGSREFLDNIGLTHRRVGDLGPIYGFQWRHFGAKYVDADSDYSNQGADQLKDIIGTIKHNPTSRRILLSAWNAADLKLMALPPCHMFCQFYVSNLPTSEQPGKKPKLSCQMYQRSCDMGLGVPFNIASYSLFTILLAHVVDMDPGEFVHCLGDAHVYNDHIEPLKQQITREPRSFPRLYVRKPQDSVADLSVEQSLKLLESFQFSDLVLEDYNPYSKIEMKMSA